MKLFVGPGVCKGDAACLVGRLHLDFGYTVERAWTSGEADWSIIRLGSATEVMIIGPSCEFEVYHTPSYFSYLERLV